MKVKTTFQFKLKRMELTPYLFIIIIFLHFGSTWDNECKLRYCKELIYHVFFGDAATNNNDDRPTHQMG